MTGNPESHRRLDALADCNVGAHAEKEGENHVFDKNRLDEYAQYVFHIVDF